MPRRPSEGLRDASQGRASRPRRGGRVQVQRIGAALRRDPTQQRRVSFDQSRLIDDSRRPVARRNRDRNRRTACVDSITKVGNQGRAIWSLNSFKEASALTPRRCHGDGRLVSTLSPSNTPPPKLTIERTSLLGETRARVHRAEW